MATSFSHACIVTRDVERLGAFYIDVLGWKTENHDMGPMGTYTLFKVPGVEGDGGGMMGMPPGMEKSPSFWLAYIATADVDASAKKVTDLGGKVKMPPTDIPNIGRFAVVEDPTGAAFALYKNAH